MASLSTANTFMPTADRTTATTSLGLAAGYSSAYSSAAYSRGGACEAVPSHGELICK